MFTGIVAAVGNIRRVDPLGNDGVRLFVEAGTLGMDDVGIGDSIAIQGACMTVVSMSADGFCVDVSAESLRRTVGLTQPGPVNLEKAMRLSDRLGGHLVSGHVDGLGVVRRYRPVGESHLLEILAPWSMAAFLVYKGSITVNGVSLTVNDVQDLPLDEALEAGWGEEAVRVLHGGAGPVGTPCSAASLQPRTAVGAGMRGREAPEMPAAGRAGQIASPARARCCAFRINLIPHTVAVTTLQHLVPGDRVNLEVDMVARYLARRDEVTRIDAGAETRGVLHRGA